MSTTTTINPAIAKFIPPTGATQAEIGLLDQLRLLVASNPRITAGDFETAIINAGVSALQGTTSIMLVIKEVEALMRSGLGRPDLTDFDRYILKAKRVLDPALLPALKELLMAGKAASINGEQLAILVSAAGVPTGHEKEKPWSEADIKAIVEAIKNPPPAPPAEIAPAFASNQEVVHAHAELMQAETEPEKTLFVENPESFNLEEAVPDSFYKWNGHPRTPVLSVAKLDQEAQTVVLTNGEINRTVPIRQFLAELDNGNLEPQNNDVGEVVAAGGTAMAPENKVPPEAPINEKVMNVEIPEDTTQREVAMGSDGIGQGGMVLTPSEPEEDQEGEAPKTVGTQIKVLVNTKGIGARFFFEGSEWEIVQIFDDTVDAVVRKKLQGTRGKGTKRLFNFSEAVGTEKPAPAKKAKEEAAARAPEPQETKAPYVDLSAQRDDLLEAQTAVFDAYDRMVELVNSNPQAREEFLMRYDNAETFCLLFKPVRDSLK